MAQKAEVKYDPAYILPSQIASAINELGFRASVMEVDGAGEASIELTVSRELMNTQNTFTRIVGTEHIHTYSGNRTHSHV